MGAEGEVAVAAVEEEGEAAAGEAEGAEGAGEEGAGEEGAGEEGAEVEEGAGAGKHWEADADVVY